MWRLKQRHKYKLTGKEATEVTGNVRNRKTHVEAKTRPVGARSDTSTSCALSVHEGRPGASSLRYAGSSHSPRMNIYSPAASLEVCSLLQLETKTKSRSFASIQSANMSHMTKTRVVKNKIKPENKPIKSPINKSVCAGLPVQEEGKQRAEQHESTENVRGGIKGHFQNFQSCRSRSTAGDSAAGNTSV